MSIARAPSLRAPWPYDQRLTIGATALDVILRSTQQVQYLTRQNLKGTEGVSPTSYAYGNEPPGQEATELYDRLVMGGGERVRSGPTSQRYFYCEDLDLSCGGLIIPALAFNAYTPTGSLGPVTDMAEFTAGGTRRLVLASGKKAFVKTGATDVAGDWVLSKDLTAGGQNITQLVPITDSGFVNYLVACVDTGNFWWWDGTDAASPSTIWTQSTLPAVSMVQPNIATGVWFRAEGTNNKVIKENAITSAAQTTVVIGRGDTKVVWLVSQNGTVVALKELGMYSIGANSSGTYVVLNSNDVFGTVRWADQGRGSVVWNDYAWIPTYDGWTRLVIPSGGFLGQRTDAGMERLVENTSPVRGTVTASAGHGTWFNYFTVYDAVNGDSYLCKYGTWLNPGTSAESWRFSEALHFYLHKWTGKKCTKLYVSDVDGSGNQRLWAGFGDGSLEWAVLPRYSPLPTADPACRFQTTGKLHLPASSQGKAANAKQYRRVGGFGEVVDGSHTGTVAFTVDGGGSTAVTGTVDSNGKELAFPDGTTGKEITPVLTIAGSSSSAPIFTGLELRYRVVAKAGLTETFAVAAEDNLVLRDGLSHDHRPAEDLRSTLLTALAQESDFVALDPLGNTARYSIEDYEEVWAPLERGGAPRWTIVIRAVQTALAS